MMARLYSDGREAGGLWRKILVGLVLAIRDGGVYLLCELQY